VRVCCARSEDDAARFAEAGLARDRIFATGSLKYDALPSEVDPARRQELRERLGLDPQSPVLVAGSTHPGEEELLCRVWERLRNTHPTLRLILVPRHVERAAAVVRRLGGMGCPVVRKTDLDCGARAPAGNEVIVVDTIGEELVTCYSLATCAFVGRSLVPPGGGQNMMEPAALGKPVLVGPHTANFTPEMELLRARRAVVVAHDERALLSQLDRLLGDARAAGALGDRARRSVMASRGATARTLERLEAALARSGLL